jgi:hypothetical protein
MSPDPYRPAALPIPVDPLAERVEVVRSGVLSDIAQGSGSEFVVQWNGHTTRIVLVRRVLVDELGVVAGGSDVDEVADVDEYLHHVVAGER